MTEAALYGFLVGAWVVLILRYRHLRVVVDGLAEQLAQLQETHDKENPHAL